MDDRYYRFKKFGNEAPNDSFFNAFQENLTGPYQKTTLDTDGTPIITKHFGDRKNVYYEPKVAATISPVFSRWFIVYAKNYTELRVAPLRIAGSAPYYSFSKGDDYPIYPMVWKDVPGADYYPWEAHWEIEGYGDGFNNASLTWDLYATRSYCSDSVKYFIKSFNINVTQRNGALDTIVNKKLYLIGTTLYLNSPTGDPLAMLNGAINDSRINNDEQYRFRNMYNDIMMFYIYDPATNNLINLGYTAAWGNHADYTGAACAPIMDYDWSDNYFYIMDRYRDPYYNKGIYSYFTVYRIVMEGGTMRRELVDTTEFYEAYSLNYPSGSGSQYYVDSSGAVHSPFVTVWAPAYSDYYGMGFSYGPYNASSQEGYFLKQMEGLDGNFIYNETPAPDEYPFKWVRYYYPGILLGKDFNSCFTAEANLGVGVGFNPVTYIDPYGTTYVTPAGSNWQWVFSSFAHVGEVFLQAYGRVSDDSGSWNSSMFTACPVTLMKAYLNGHSIEQEVADGCGVSLENIRAIIYLPGKS